MSAAAARAGNVLALPARPRQPAGQGGERRDSRNGHYGREGHEGRDGHEGLDSRVDRDDQADHLVAAANAAPALDADDDGTAPPYDLLATEDFDDEEAASTDPPAPGPRTTGARSRPGHADPAIDDADDARLAQWIGRIARQDAQALEALYDATAARVHGLVRRLTQRAALAEEVLEETYWQVWREAPRFDATRGRPITWLLSMARSRAIDALRRERRFRHEPLPDDGDDATARWTDAAAPAPQDLLEATRGHAHVHAALASLEPRARQLVAMAFFRGLTHEEIAQQQGLPLGTVKSLIRRALQQLRRVLEASHA